MFRDVLMDEFRDSVAFALIFGAVIPPLLVIVGVFFKTKKAEGRFPEETEE